MRILQTATLALILVSSPFLYAQHEDEHGHADDAVIGFMICVDAAQRLAVEFDGDEVLELPSVDGVLVGWAGDEPGFNTLAEDEPDEGFFAVAAGANVVLEIVSIEPGFKAHTPGFADILDAPGETWELGAAPFDTHPEWHIDPAAEGFDDAQEIWSVTVRLFDTGATSYLPSEPFTILFEREHEDEHGHADDAVIGFTICVDATQRLGVEFDGDEVFELPSVDGVLVGWAGDEPGFNTLAEDEPDEGFFAVAAGANVVLEIVSIEAGFKAHTPGFTDILDAPGETWELGAAPFDTHPEWHIDPAAEGFDELQEIWSVTVRMIDTGKTGYLPSNPFTIQFARGAVGPFVRGDCNDDGEVDLADGVRMLDVKFLGGETPPCAAACDFDGTGGLDVSTAVFLFNFLFQGGLVPPAPYPTAAGSNAPADIALGCR